MKISSLKLCSAPLKVMARKCCSIQTKIRNKEASVQLKPEQIYEYKLNSLSCFLNRLDEAARIFPLDVWKLEEVMLFHVVFYFESRDRMPGFSILCVDSLKLPAALLCRDSWAVVVLPVVWKQQQLVRLSWDHFCLINICQHLHCSKLRLLHRTQQEVLLLEYVFV